VAVKGMLSTMPEAKALPHMTIRAVPASDSELGHPLDEARGFQGTDHNEEAHEEEYGRPLHLVEHVLYLGRADDHGEGGAGQCHHGGVEAGDLLEKESDHRGAGDGARAHEEAPVLDLRCGVKRHDLLPVLVCGL
jgi:hypothetical protein